MSAELSGSVIVLSICAMVVATGIAGVGALFLKKGARGFELHPKKLLRNRFLQLGIFFYALSVMIYMALLHYLPLSLAYPLSSIGYIWVVFLSKRYLNEKITMWRWVGIGAILIGVTLLSFG